MNTTLTITDQDITELLRLNALHDAGKKQELILMNNIWKENRGMCQITNTRIPFSPHNCAHILGKGAYGAFRLLKKNIIHVHPRIHDLHDNQGRDKLLAAYPKAIIIYDMAEQLKSEYWRLKKENLI